MTLRGCFVTGTDTEVGKTRVGAALLHWLGARGLRCVGCKPVAAGRSWIDGRLVNEDVAALRAAGSVPAGDAEVGPFQFDAPCAPQVAAALEGRHIERAALRSAVDTAAARADWVVVEGVGGFCVPLAPDFDSADLAADFGLPVLLVVGLRLGCINHALLSAQAIQARGLRLAGWVANGVDPRMIHRDATLASLRAELWSRHRAPCIGSIPWLVSAEAAEAAEAIDPAAVAAHLDDAALQEIFR